MDSVQVMEAQLLNEMTSGVLGPINDILEIDAETRTIYVPSTELLFGVVTDADAERKYFRCPRIVGDNLDLTTFGLRVHFENAQGNRDKYIVTDVEVDGDYITFSWCLSEKVLKYSGPVNFAICAVEALADGTTKIRWNTTLTTGTVLGGLEVDDLDIEEETQSRDVLQQLLNLMDTEVSARTKDVQDECAKQVQNVKDEGSKQIEMVEDKGAATLATIPEDYTAMSKMVDEIYRTSGPVIKQEVEGKVIAINDSAAMPLLGMKIYGKSEQLTTMGANILPNEAKTSESLGVVFTVNDDGSIRVEGTATGTVYLTLSGGYAAEQCPIPDWLVPGETYYISDASIYLYTTDSRQYTYTNMSFVMPDDCAYYGIFIRVGSGVTMSQTNYPMLNQGDTALPYEPYTGGQPSPNPEYPQEIKSVENPITYVNGKNLVNLDEGLNGEFVKNEDGTYTIMRHGGYRFSEFISVYVPANTPITGKAHSISTDGFSFFYVQFMSADSNLSKAMSISPETDTRTITCDYDVTKMRVYMPPAAVDGDYVTFADFQVEIGRTPTEFEPYTERRTLDSTSTLRAIPVTSGGNYVDESGQHWVCDYRDWERGVDVQMIGKMILLPSEYWSLYKNDSLGISYSYRIKISTMLNGSTVGIRNRMGIVCTHLRYGGYASRDELTGIGITESQYIYLRFDDPNNSMTSTDELNAWLEESNNNGNPVTMHYVLATPIETPIPTEELLAYKALHTNYPNTTIVNDSDAHMEVTYGTDTKMYIDKKFAELQAALTDNS